MDLIDLIGSYKIFEIPPGLLGGLQLSPFSDTSPGLSKSPETSIESQP